MICAHRALTRLAKRSQWALGALGLAVCACGRGPGERASLEARLVLSARDTLRIRARASAHYCHPRGVLLFAIDGGSGVLVWARDSGLVTSGDYALLTRGDSITPRGAMVSVRFVNGEAGRGVTLDSGKVTLSRDGGRIGARARGSGLEPTGGVRLGLDATFESMPLARDTTTCRQQI